MRTLHLEVAGFAIELATNYLNARRKGTEDNLVKGLMVSEEIN